MLMVGLGITFIYAVKNNQISEIVDLKLLCTTCVDRGVCLAISD